MKIKVIGHGDLMSKAFYPSFLIDNILLGAPNGVLKELQRMHVNLDDINVIVIPHLHGDEYFDLPMIIAHEHKRKREKPLVIMGPKNLKRKVTKLIFMAFGEYYLDDLKVTFISGSSVQNANVTADLYFTFIDVRHADLRKAYGLIINNEKSSIGFSFGAKICPGLSFMLKDVKNCVINVGDNKNEESLTIDEFKKISDEYKVNFVPVGYPEHLYSELEAIKNTKMINEGEQFYI